MEKTTEKSGCCGSRKAASCGCSAAKQSAERVDRGCCCGPSCGCGESCGCPSQCGCSAR